MALGVPFLHVVSVAGQTTIVDRRVLVAAVLAAMPLGGALIFPDEMRILGRHLARLGFGRVSAGLLLIFAVLPSVVPYDHLLGHTDANDPAQEAVHAAHCHVSPGSCADAPLSAGPGQLIFSAPLIVAPPMLTVLVQLSTSMLSGRTIPPDLRPPIA